jgi:hypothetical protein
VGGSSWTTTSVTTAAIAAAASATPAGSQRRRLCDSAQGLGQPVQLCDLGPALGAGDEMQLDLVPQIVVEVVQHVGAEGLAQLVVGRRHDSITSIA